MPSPLVLLADSAPLFRSREDGRPWLAGLREGIVRAAYLGASNGDRAEFYEIFEAAMDRIDVADRRHVRAEAAPGDVEYVAQSDLVLLAGGDVEVGLSAFHRSGVDAAVRAARERGALLVGVSAGAVQLGVVTDLPEEGASSPALPLVGAAGRVTNGHAPNGHGGAPGATPDPHLPSEDANEDPDHDSRGFRFAPFQVDVHDEPTWAALRRRVGVRRLGARGIGIPRGAAAIIHTDATLEPVGGTLTEIVRSSMGVVESMIVGR